MCHHNNTLALIYRLAFGMGLEITSITQLYPCLDIRISQSKEHKYFVKYKMLEANILKWKI